MYVHRLPVTTGQVNNLRHLTPYSRLRTSIYIYIHICIHIHTYICVYIYMYVHVHKHAHFRSLYRSRHGLVGSRVRQLQYRYPALGHRKTYCKGFILVNGMKLTIYPPHPQKWPYRDFSTKRCVMF